MQIGNSSGAPRQSMVSATSATEAGAVERTESAAVQELQLQALSPEELSAVRSYLADVNLGTRDVRELSPQLVPGLDRREHQQMQRGYRTLTDGGNVFKLLNERQDIADKLARFVEENKKRDLFPFPPIPQPPAPAQEVEEPARQFLDGFDRWDRNQDGFLDRDELGRALQDPNMTPEQGAAFAVIYERCTSPRRDTQNPANNEVDLLADGKLSRDEVRSITGRSGAYQRALEKINRSPDQAFIGPPDGDAVVQGRHGSCAFLAALIALAESDPAAIQRMIHDNGDGSWNVTFPGRGPVRVTLSPAERALGATSDAQGGQNGLWVAILEKAYAITQAGTDSPNPLQIYDNGENPQTTSQVLSGQDIRKIQLGQSGGPFGAVQETLVRRAIESALLEGRPVTCALFNQNNPWQLPTHHAYTVLNLRGDNITVRNPWGDNASGEGQTNPNTGWTPDMQNDGRITIRLSDFIRYFSEVNC